MAYAYLGRFNPRYKQLVVLGIGLVGESEESIESSALGPLEFLWR